MTRLNTVFIIIFLISVIQIYFYNIGISCFQNTDLGSIFISTFFHKKMVHLLSSVHSLFHFLRLEDKIGGRKFITIFFTLLVLNTLSDWIYYKSIGKRVKNINTGLSGILFGVLTWELLADDDITNREIITNILSIIFLLIIKREQMSFQGHMIGIVWGAVLSIFYK